MPVSLQRVRRVRKAKHVFPDADRGDYWRRLLADVARRSRNEYPKVWPEERNVSRYAEALGLRRKDLLTTLKKQIDRQGNIAVLDMGAGQGFFLKTLKKLFGEKITTVGLSLKRPRSTNGIDELRIQLAERPSYKKSFDFVFSIHLLEYSREPGEVVKNICRALKVGGIAYIRSSFTSSIYQHLAKVGLIKIIHLNPDGVVIFERRR